MKEENNRTLLSLVGWKEKASTSGENREKGRIGRALER